MKSSAFRGLTALFLWASATFAFAGPYKTEIITSSPLTITLPEGVFFKISNFTQEGGTTRGVVAVTINGVTANVLTASQINSSDLTVPPEEINKVTIAGPATITIAPVANATLFITHRRQRDGELQATPTPTPAATPTATPTATP